MDNRPQDSLQVAWGVNSQAVWQFYKKVAIQAAINFFQNSHPSYHDFFQFVADKRREIGVALKHENAHQIGAFRNASYSMWTTMGLNGRYASYFPYLLNEYDRIRQNARVNTLTCAGSPGFLRDMELKEFLSGESCELVVENVFLGIMKYQCLDNNNNEQTFLEVWNPIYAQVLKLDERATLLYDALEMADSDEEKIRLIQEIAYCQAVAGKCMRGGAAITEMSTEALLGSQRLNADYKGQVPMDLEALFSNSYKDFERKTQISQPNVKFDNSFAKDLATLKAALHDFILNKQKIPTTISSFFASLFSANTKADTVEISAANKLLKLLDAEFTIRFTVGEIQALKQHPELSKVLNSYIEKGFLPGEIFEFLSVGKDQVMSKRF